MDLSIQELEWGRRNNMSKIDKNNQANIPEIDPSRFELVHTNVGAKIHDEKFDTKATTFAKDALKRFAKNKSSVVGATIIGILLLGSFLSIFSPHDIQTAHTDERLLPGKVFEGGTGWWDGCESINDAPYDDINGVAFGYRADCTYNLTVSGEKLSEKYYSFAKGGYYRITSDAAYSDASKKITLTKYTTLTYNYTPIPVNPADEFTLNIEMDNEDNILDNILCDGVRVALRYIDAEDNNKEKRLTIFPTVGDDESWYNEFSTIDINVSEIMTAQGIAASEKCYFEIYGKPKVSEKKCYYLMKTLTMTSSNEETQALLNQINITDANYTAGLGPDSLRQFPVGYWQSTGERNVWHAKYKTASFRYDRYKAVYGNVTNVVIGGSDIKKYIANGWCEFPNFEDITTFKVLDDKCPLKEVYSHSSAGGVDQFTGLVCYYQYKGYSEMPKYVFGTDAMGHDLLTVALSSLKTSLLVAIISSAACLAIGLVWGSISGYFGGNVDIIMERITDILGGVPWIVMMTLIILLLGNNVVTFAIALIMTGWISTATRTRMQFYRFKGREYILASRTLGASDARLIFRHILPNGLGTIVTGSVLMIPGCIFSEASISYLGLGLQGVNSFGVLLSENQVYLSTKPLLIIVPAIIISLLMISFNLFGNGLRDALNPTLKGGE